VKKSWGGREGGGYTSNRSSFKGRWGLSFVEEVSGDRLSGTASRRFDLGLWTTEVWKE